MATSEAHMSSATQRDVEKSSRKHDVMDHTALLKPLVILPSGVKAFWYTSCLVYYTDLWCKRFREVVGLLMSKASLLPNDLSPATG